MFERNLGEQNENEETARKSRNPSIEDAQIIDLYNVSEDILNSATSIEDWKERARTVYGVKSVSTGKTITGEELFKFSEIGELGASFLPRQIRGHFKELLKAENQDKNKK